MPTPVLFLGDTVLTGGEVADWISRYVQAFEAFGAGRGTSGALLALNRLEVLFILGAGQTQGYRRTSLHPLGSLEDHACPRRQVGEAVTAVVVLRAGTDTSEEAVARIAAEIKASVKDRKGGLHTPKQVLVADAIPMTALRKPDKKALRAQFWGDRDRSVG